MLFPSAAFYTEPRLTINVNPTNVLVQYETVGFPKPELLWKGEDGTNLSYHAKTTIQLTKDLGLYSVTSSYTAPNTPLNFTFVLKNPLLDQHLQRLVSLTGKDLHLYQVKWCWMWMWISVAVVWELISMKMLNILNVYPNM